MKRRGSCGRLCGGPYKGKTGNRHMDWNGAAADTGTGAVLEMSDGWQQGGLVWVVLVNRDLRT